MPSIVKQYCINVVDLDRSVAFYEALGIPDHRRTEIDQAWEALLHHPSGHGGVMQLAQQKDQADPFERGTSFWKLYIDTQDIEDTFRRAVDAGAVEVSKPQRMDRWPVTIAFVEDPDGYLVELVQRHPWPDGSPEEPWLGQYCINVTDIEATVAFYETLGLACNSRTEIPQAFEAVMQSIGGEGGKIQLAQQKDQDGPIRMGSTWKLYIYTDDCVGLHDAAVAAGHTSTMAPMRLDRWPTTIAFLADPDGYSIELVQKHDS